MNKSFYAVSALLLTFGLSSTARADKDCGGCHRIPETRVIFTHPVKGNKGLYDKISTVTFADANDEHSFRLEVSTKAGVQFNIPFESRQDGEIFWHNIGWQNTVLDVSDCWELGQAIGWMPEHHNKRCGFRTYEVKYECRLISSMRPKIHDFVQTSFKRDFELIDPASGKFPAKSIHECDYSKKKRGKKRRY